MKFVYCANCGQRSLLFRKALPGYGRIIDLIEPHECTEEVQEFDLQPLEVPTVTMKVDNSNKFMQKLHELSSEPAAAGALRDQRPERDELKTTAPSSLQGLIDSQPSSAPVGDINEEPKDEQ